MPPTPQPRSRFGAAIGYLAGVLAATASLPPLQLSAQPVRCTDGRAAGFACHDIDLLAVLSPRELGGDEGVRLNDLWGWADPLTGREYAFVGRTDGTAIVDVTDPAETHLIGNLAGAVAHTPSPWRDLKTHAGHLFVVANTPRPSEPRGMQVLELTALRELEGRSRTALPHELVPDAIWRGIATAMNLAINSGTGIAYLADSYGEHACPGLLMVDLNEPLAPVPMGCFAHRGTGRRGLGRTHDAHCVLYRGPDAAYLGREICIGFNETAVSVADLTDPGTPIVVGEAAYPGMGYAHQGWLAEDHRHLYSTDELDELQGLVAGTRILVWDLEILAEPVLVAEYIGPSPATDHNLLIRGDRLFLAANRGGLRVLDISGTRALSEGRDSAERIVPVEIGYFVTVRDDGAEDVAERERGAGGAWGVYPFLPSGNVLVSSRDEGLFVLRVR